MTEWLARGEKVTYQWPGSTKLSTLLGGLAAPDVWLRATDRHRLHLTMSGDDRVTELVFASPADGSLRVVGPGPRQVAGLPTVLVEVSPRGAPPFRVLLNDTVATYLPRWSASHGSLAAGSSSVPPLDLAATSPRTTLDEAQLTLPCGTCGSPMGSPSQKHEITCPHCGTVTTLPADAIERREWIAGALRRARQAGDLFDDEQVTRLTQLEGSTYARSSMLAALPMLAILVATVVAPAVAVRFEAPPEGFGAEVRAFAGAVGWLGFALGIVLGLVLGHHRQVRIYRRELRGHLQCVSLPYDSVPARCRYCNAPIAIVEGFVACEYCGACNLATTAAARSASEHHTRRAALFDHRAREAREAERRHLAALVRSVRRGHALGMIVLAPVVAAVLAVGLAGLHVALG